MENWLRDIVNFKQYNKFGKLFLSNNQKENILNYLKNKGETEKELLEEGWERVHEIVKCSKCGNEFNYLSKEESGMGYVKCSKCNNPVTQKDILKEKGFNKFNTIPSTPDEISKWDRGKDTRIRYEYVGPQDSKNRSFCAEMMAMNKLFRREDINNMFNTEFGNYNIFKWSGSFNCRHNWQSVIFRRKKTNQGEPIDAPITDGVVKERIEIDIDKRNDATIKKAGDEPDFILKKIKN